MFKIFLFFYFFYFSNGYANDLLEKFLAQDVNQHLELNKKLNAFILNWWEEYQGNPANLKKMKVCKEEFVSAEI